MKKIYLGFCFAMLSLLGIAQTSYTVNYTIGGGNPGLVNTDNDDITTGWNTIVAASVASNQWSTSVSIPFTFNYYGSVVTSLRASSNGLVTFSNTTSLPNDNSDLPSTSLPDSTIACFWDAFTTAPPTNTNDLVVWKIAGAAPNRQLWVKWVSYELGAPSISNATFSCVLEETTNKIYLVEGQFSVSAATPTITTTAGLQLNQTTANQYLNQYITRTANVAAYTDNNFITFTPYNKANMVYVSSNTELANIKNTPKGSSNEEILKITVVTNGELNPIAITQLNLSTSGTSNNSDLTQAKIFYTGNNGVFSAVNQFGSTVSSPSGSFIITGSQNLLKDTNYFWLTYNLSSSATALNTIDAECNLLTVNSIGVVPNTTAPLGARTISEGLSGTKTVGTAGNYNYLSDAFKDINTNGLSGNLTLSITSDIEDTAIASLSNISQNGFKVKIVPSADVLRSITGRFLNSLIELNGSQNVVIDGKGPISGTGKYLRFLNKESNASTFSYINGARFDTIQNCIIEGTNNLQTIGVVNFGSSVNSVTGVRDLLFTNNDVRDRNDSVGIPTILFYSAGSANLTNSNITISNSNLFNYRRSAVYVATTGNGGNWRILSNSFYYNATTNIAAGDVVSIMLIPGVNAGNNQIIGNYFGGQSPLCGGNALLNANGINFVVMNINTSISSGTTVQNNVIQNINLTSTAAVDFAGIRIESGRAVVTGNLIGHTTNANSIINNMRLTLCIYGFVGGYGEIIVSNNTIANISGTGVLTTSGVRAISFQGGGASPYIYNNLIYNLASAGAQVGPQTTTLMGIGLVSSAEAGQSYIGYNKVYNLSTSNTTANIVPTGIVIDNSTENGIVEGNIVYNITCPSSGTSAFIHGIYIVGSVKNWIFRNNTISITNGTNTNAIIIRGISDNAAGNITNYFNNTVYIGGTASSGALNSFAFERRAASNVALRNNLLYNARTGGTGIHAAIGNVATTPTTNWTSNTSNYNLLLAASSSSVGAWGNTFTPQTLAQWQTSSLGDLSSWAESSAIVPANSLFKNLTNGDLTIDSTNALCWYAQGKGIALTNNTLDIQLQNRSISITNGTVDIGADEFTTTTTPPNATESAAPANSSTTNYIFGNRKIASINWGASGVTPTFVSVKFYSGVNAPNLVASKTQFNGYYTVTPTGGSFYDYTPIFTFDSAMFGNTNGSATAKIAYYQPTVWSLETSSSYNVSNLALEGGTSLLASTLPANFTGTSNTNPLPIKLVNFNAKNVQKDIQVNWTSSQEINASKYELEVSTNGTIFTKINTTKAKGNSNTLTTYSFMHQNAFEKLNAKTLYYRLRMIDNDGTFEYSKTVIVNNNANNQVTTTVYPNPLNETSVLNIVSTENETFKVTIFNLNGSSVFSKMVESNQGENNISLNELNNLPKGIYFINIVGKTYNNSIRLVK